MLYFRCELQASCPGFVGTEVGSREAVERQPTCRVVQVINESPRHGGFAGVSLIRRLFLFRCNDLHRNFFIFSPYLHAIVQFSPADPPWVRGGLILKRKPESADVLRKLGDLASGKANDTVRLVFLGAKDVDLLDQLDLSLLSEIKRGANGVIEVKLINRLEALELLAKLVGAGQKEHQGAEEFYRAVDEAAARIGETGYEH
jgi:hypothetical protein